MEDQKLENILFCSSLIISNNRSILFPIGTSVKRCFLPDRLITVPYFLKVIFEKALEFLQIELIGYISEGNDFILIIKKGNYFTKMLN